MGISPPEDGLQVKNPRPGDFEWWYFDLMDCKGEIALKLVAHLGTDPLRRKVFPTLALSLRTPDIRWAAERKYSLKEFEASTERCHVKMGGEFLTNSEEKDGVQTCRLQARTCDFEADLIFTGELAGWNPFAGGHEVERAGRRARFGWVIPQPRARVEGEVKLGAATYRLDRAHGYHDHNFWWAGEKRRLFMDEVITHWYWGRAVSGDLSAIFMETFTTEGPLRSLLVAEGGRELYASNDALTVSVTTKERDLTLKTDYPSQLVVSSEREEFLFSLELKQREVVERKDLLQGLNPLLRWLIKRLVAKPSYYGVLADAELTIGERKSKGIALYELMFFKGRDIKFEPRQ